MPNSSVADKSTIMLPSFLETLLLCRSEITLFSASFDSNCVNQLYTGEILPAPKKIPLNTFPGKLFWSRTEPYHSLVSRMLEAHTFSFSKNKQKLFEFDTLESGTLLAKFFR